MFDASLDDRRSCAYPFLAGGGEMGRRIRSFDWATTPLGPIDSWTHELRSAASFCLNSNFPVAIYWGPEHILLYNDQWSATVGEKQPWALGQPADHAWPESWPILQPLLEQVIETGQATRCRDQLLPILRHGFPDERYFDYTFSPVRSESGGVAGIFSAVLETTSRVAENKLQRNAERLRLLWEAASVLLSTDEPDVMLRQIFDRIKNNFHLDGYFNFVVDENRTGLRMLSCAGVPDAIVENVQRIRFGQAVCGCVAQQRQPIVAECVQQSDAEMVQLIKSLGIRAYACFPLMESDQLLGTLSFASSQRDTFENDELDFFQTICQYVTAAYVRMHLISELRRAHQRKDEFLATLAHELRNPMAPIRNGVQLLKMIVSGTEDTEAVLGMMERQLQQLVHLVDDLLDISRISRGKIELRRERMLLSEAIAQAVETSRPLIEGAGHHLRVQQPGVPIWVDADKTRLAQVFSNLLNNSAKYTEPGGQIELTVEANVEWVNVSVRDNGIGIPEHKLPLVFEMFTQVDKDLNRSQGGLGIGLAIVKQLVEMHGGRVEAHSPGHGQGSQFTVHLPLASTVKETAATVHLSTSSDGCHRILVVDDNQDAANSLALMLRLLGNDARTAHDGSAAIALAEAFQPELIVLDIGMPGMNGYEVAQAIRQHAWGQNIRLAALTGWGQEEDRRKSYAAGFNVHLVKPIEPKELRSLIASL